ncbi:MAG: hypothetical protein H0W06_05020 [Chloroflexia bacterium]|nr:hypothetical protein [Chloroflexia bacterium]MBA3641857.1 hypothetical protein [Acidobacteriota bacterium]
MRDEPLPKPVRDPIPKLRDPLPKLRDPIGPLGPGTIQPFSLATPHHAMLGGGLTAADPNGVAYLAQLQQQLLDVEAAVAQARATAAQATADAGRLEDSAASLVSAYEQVLNSLRGDGNT